MKTAMEFDLKFKFKAVLIALVIAIPALFLGTKVWPPAPGFNPTLDQASWLLLLNAIEALTLGIGVAFLALARPFFLDGRHKNFGPAVFVSLAWLLVSWWPHDLLHAHNGAGVSGLLAIDYGFHLTLILATLIVTRAAYRDARHHA